MLASGANGSMQPGSANGVAAVDEKVHAVDHGDGVRCEEHARGSDLIRVGEAPGRDLSLELVTLGTRPGFATEVGEDDCGTNRVGGDTATCPFGR